MHLKAGRCYPFVEGWLHTNVHYPVQNFIFIEDPDRVYPLGGNNIPVFKLHIGCRETYSASPLLSMNYRSPQMITAPEPCIRQGKITILETLAYPGAADLLSFNQERRGS
ncbi:hypothetical protein D3C74_373720 [compost metagenome]